MAVIKAWFCQIFEIDSQIIVWEKNFTMNHLFHIWYVMWISNNSENNLKYFSRYNKLPEIMQIWLGPLKKVFLVSGIMKIPDIK